jgi:OmpA family protein
MVFFDWDRYNLSQQALTTIQQAADSFKSTGSARITATGHTDLSGPADYNMALSLRRANTVKDALVRDGVPPGAIMVIGKGKTQPLVPTADGVREPQNRRVEIVVGAGMAAAPAIFSDPAAYCKALSDKWRQYRNSQIDSDTAAAIAKCEAGNYAEGIPVLEDATIRAKIPLPSPGYRWPGRPFTAPY